MKHLKRNLIIIFIINAIVLIGCLAFTIQQFSLHPSLSLGMILLLIVDFIVLSTFTSLMTIAIQYLVKKIKERRK